MGCEQDAVNRTAPYVDASGFNGYDGRRLLMQQFASRNDSALSYSVIIPVCNGEAHLDRCLEALAASTRKPDEIVVVDDSSNDRSAAIAHGRGCKVITLVGGPTGPATARNRGVGASSGDIIVFVDCDVAVHPETLALMEGQFLANPDLCGVFGSYDDRPTAVGLVSSYRNLLHHHVHQRSRREASTFWAGCGAIRREVLEAAAGFDETYRWASIEDIQLGLRLHSAGHRLLLCPEIQATHRKRWSLLQVIHTDVFYRAIPWTKLLLSQGSWPNDLNLRWENRISAVAAWMLLLLLVFSATSVHLLGTVAGPVLLLLGCNWGLYRLFHRRCGFTFLLGAIGLHWLHYLYTSATFVIVALEVYLRSVTASAAHLHPETTARVFVGRD
jgi:glycosyltransferase involved in cell wall biosynthesis